MTKLVGYYRVSTRKQERSGLGLDAQKQAVEEYARKVGGKIIGTYTEIESGRRDDRPQLEKALGHAKVSPAVLVVARLDRLSRSLKLLVRLREAGVDFVATDVPEACPLTVSILIAMAEHETRLISARTKAALAAARRRGVQLGSARPGHWRGREHRRQAGARAGGRASAVVRAKAVVEVLAVIGPLVEEMRAEGYSYQAIADELNAKGFATRRGLPWTAVAVLRVYRRLEAAA